MRGPDSLEVRSGEAQLYARVYGRGEGPLAVIMIPSLGRGARDFDRLGSAVAREGFTSAALDQRGIGDSRGSLEDLALSDLAADVAAVAAALDSKQIVAVGHAFGGGIARRMAVTHPDLVAGVVAIAAGGKIHDPDPNVYRTFREVFENVDEDTRRAAIAESFFADRTVPEDWLHGWWPDVFRLYVEAQDATPHQEWWAGGEARILIIQGLQDRVAPPQNGHDVKAIAGKRATVIDLEGASHALLPEQPEAIEHAVLGFLRELAR